MTSSGLDVDSGLVEFDVFGGGGGVGKQDAAVRRGKDTESSVRAVTWKHKG